MKRPENYLLYIGNAYPHKNLERLLEAVVNCKLKIVNCKLILVGREDYFYKRLKEKVKKMDLEEVVIFWGETTRKELDQLYKNARALILPSLMEGFGLPALEAMACGCLVLASDIPAFHEILADAAIYFDPLNVEEITEKIKEVCYHDLNHWNKLRARGLERAKMFSWQKTARETLKVYQEVLGLPQVSS